MPDLRECEDHAINIHAINIHNRLDNCRNDGRGNWDSSNWIIACDDGRDDLKGVNTISQFNHELIMVWVAIFIFGLSLSAIVLLIMEVTG